MGAVPMQFPQFLVGMFATSFITAIWAELETGSAWRALGWAIVAMIILQVGYVGLAVRLIYKLKSQGTEADLVSANSTPPVHRARPRKSVRAQSGHACAHDWSNSATTRPSERNECARVHCLDQTQGSPVTER
ncbi:MULTISPECIES: hypothetical protein [unclassified Mesorhizobium]|uniref:hypothetical protein n=1 Tax=unclassified Mesorhizobium TaxID=325217 RepID=UPI001676CD9E|nr:MULTISPECIES: hypothetical protein [unclassified Mesorhizobium]